MFLSSLCTSHRKIAINGCTDFDKNGKWLKLLGHVSVIPVQFPIKRFFKWMHGFQVRAKTNYVLCIFSSKHSASFCMGNK